MPGIMYPPAAPSVSGATITVEQFLRQPARVQRVVEDLTLNRFIADYIFTQGDAPGGAVIYDRVTAGQFYTDRDVQAIEPGSEFPLTGISDATPLTAAVTKWGGASPITYEEVRRDARDVLARGLAKLRNTIVKKVDGVAVSVLAADASVPTAAAIAAWNVGTGDPISDLEIARTAIDDADLGYNANTILANPQSRTRLMARTDIRGAMPREAAATNPLIRGAEALQGLLGMTWMFSNRIPVGTIYLLDRGAIGSIRDEMPLYTRTVDQPERERWLIMAARVTVPVITDPLAAYKITGA